MRLFAFIFLAFSAASFAQNGLIKNYYTNGQPESEINYMNNVRDGEAKFYWDNGKIQTELTYNNGKVEGLVKEYYPTGVLKETYTIQDGKKEGPLTFYNEQGAFVSEIYYQEGKRIIDKDAVTEESVTAASLDSTSGNIVSVSPIDSTKPKTPAVTNENAEQNTELTKKTEPAAAVVEKLKETPEIIADTLIGFETEADVMPVPNGGWVWLYKKLSYPREAREKNITGETRILAYIDEKGKVVEAKILTGFNKECDEAAKNAVTYTRFKPAYKDGRDIKVKMVIPVQFHLP